MSILNEANIRPSGRCNSPVAACAFALLLAAAVAACEAAEPATKPDGFRGTKFGSGLQAVSRILQFDPDECLIEAEGFTSCRVEFSVGDVATKAVYRFSGDRLGQVNLTFSPDDFELIRSAFTDRYGKPDALDVSPSRTRMNVEYRNVTVSWTWPGVRLVLSKYGDNVDESFVSITTEKFRRDASRAEDAARRAVRRSLDQAPTERSERARTSGDLRIEKEVARVHAGMTLDQIMAMFGHSYAEEHSIIENQEFLDCIFPNGVTVRFSLDGKVRKAFATTP